MRALLWLWLVASPALAEAYGPVFVSRVTDVYDGDTFRVDIDEWPAIIGRHIPVRLRGIDTPELRSRCDTPEAKARETSHGLRARDVTAARLAEASTITLHRIERGSFFRLIAEVRLDGASLGQALLEAGLAVPYGKDTWCDDAPPLTGAR